MHRILRPCLALVCLTACPADDDEDDTGGETSPTSSPTTTSPTTTTPGESSGEPTTDPTVDPTVDPTDATESTGTDPTDATDTGSDTTPADTGSTGEPTDLCDPPDADPCIACAQANCCDAYTACYSDPDCVCAVDCILATGDYATCLGPMCNSPDPTPAMDIGLCYGMTCAAECGFG